MLFGVAKFFEQIVETVRKSTLCAECREAAQKTLHAFAAGLPPYFG
ncbi:hypothetical protein ABFT80_18495 [Mesorhizobium sp. SB112]